METVLEMQEVCKTFYGDGVIVKANDHVNFNLKQCCEYAKQINPNIEIIQLSATSGENINQFSNWLIANKAELQSDYSSNNKKEV